MPEDPNRPEGPLMASVERLRREMDHWFEAALSQGGRALDRFGIKVPERSAVPSIDVVETGDDVVILADLPGVDPAGLDVSLAGNMLTIKGTKPVTPIAEGHVVHTNERAHGRFCRSIPLPVAVNPESVVAESRDGVLRIRLAKSERVKSRQIQIRVGESSPVRPIGGEPTSL